MNAASRITVWLASLAWLMPAVCVCDVLATSGECCETVVETDCQRSCCQADGPAESVDRHHAANAADLPAAPGDCACAPDVETTTTINAVVAVPPAMPVRLVRPAAESSAVPVAVLPPPRPSRVLWNVWLC